MNKNLEEIYKTDDLTLIRKTMAESTSKKDHTTLDTLIGRNQIQLSSVYPKKNKKHNGKSCNTKNSTER